MTFEEFARARLPALLRFAKVLCVDRGTAEDMVQEVLLRVHARWQEIAGLDRPEVYVRRMIVNEYLSWRRKRARVMPQARLPDEAAAPDPAVGLADRAQLVAEIARLPRRQRAVVVMRYFGGMSDAEIAADLGCSQGTVRSHLSRAVSWAHRPARWPPDAKPRAKHRSAAGPIRCGGTEWNAIPDSRVESAADSSTGRQFRHWPDSQSCSRYFSSTMSAHVAEPAAK
ncbi:MAG TPA: SigE family RNA polymerase sigma factor [Mycobacterium sp.]|nr:SigE family RNA polymerase sigma factor [Mycobacterium sp.]